MHLHANGFLLRALVPDDAPALTAAVRESLGSLGKWMPWAHPAYGETDARDWIAFCTAARADGSAHEFGIFGPDASLLGAAGLNQFNRPNQFCNLGYWVRQTAQRRGVALAAVDALARYAFDTLALTRIEIVVAERNQPSLAVALKAGATLEGLARNRLVLHGRPVAAHMLSLLPATSGR